MDLAVDWFGRSQLLDGSGGAGWGWVADVPPNPQNTAEVVCALSAAEREVPRAAEVLRLLRRSVVGRQGGRSWSFEAPVDIAWRLRALRRLGVDDDDHDVVTCIEALVGTQDDESGGWRMSGRAGPISITATAAAMHALGELAAADERIARAVLRGVTFLATSMVSEDVRAQPMYAAAHIAAVLARPEFVSVGGRRSRRATELAVRRLLDGLARDEDKVEEEPFRRGEIADTWRHLSLHLSVGAVAAADSASIFTPEMRRSLTELLDLQEMMPLHAHRGGFRTSPEGFVTSYATTQALEAMTQARHAVHEINPGRVFDIICSIEGVHHSDGQTVVGWGRRAVVMNSYAGAALLGIAALAGTTIATMAVAFADDLGKPGSRALVVWGTLIVATGALMSLTTCFPSVSTARISAGVFAGFTAVVLPVITFLLS